MAIAQQAAAQLAHLPTFRRMSSCIEARHPDAFSHEDINTAELFAAQAAQALRLALRIAQLKDTSEDLNAALAHRKTIDMALGAVMAQNRCSRDAAFIILKRAANAREMKLRDVAASVIASVCADGLSTRFDA
ncbi:ANTAR domain-containing protein [Arthrobacter sp. 92]|uniref:ANTAR domain-containing protein n=1 Tax=Arthrobacter sp. 92 TaxID=3418175 RepID=UPI003CFD12E8